MAYSDYQTITQLPIEMLYNQRSVMNHISLLISTHEILNIILLIYPSQWKWAPPEKIIFFSKIATIVDNNETSFLKFSNKLAYAVFWFSSACTTFSSNFQQIAWIFEINFQSIQFIMFSRDTDKYMHTYIIGLYNPSVSIQSDLALLGWIFDRIFALSEWILSGWIFDRIFAKNLQRAIRRGNIFFPIIRFNAWPGIQTRAFGVTSQRFTY